ncbi:MAG: pitrilysin family protein [Candidatus Wildermuthbacteria bacterium]|nr:pitrilysin family protein [Candidatus Wildermuthbacteria bacterium]
MFHKTTLKNGLRIITSPQEGTQALTILVLVGTGSKYEKKEINGISHFLEHMYFKGTKKRPSALLISETLDRVGGIYNAFTGEECTGYFAKTEASHFELAMDWVSDIFLNSTLPPKEIEKEKKVIWEEINMRQDHPMEYVQVLWSKLLYGDQPAGWDTAGTKESVEGISRKKLTNYLKTQYVASNTIVSVAGKIDSSFCIEKIKEYFSKIKLGSPLSKPKVIERQDCPEVFLQTKQTDQAHLCLGVRGYNIFHPQRYAVELLAVILGGMMSSRLFTEVREKLGLAYYIRTEANLDPDAGYLVTQAGVDNKRVERAIVTIVKEYKKIARKKVSQSDLKKAKDNTKGRMALLLESSDAQASFCAIQELLEKKVLTREEIFSEIDKVRDSDILKVARDIFRPENLNLAMIGPFKDKNKFKELLKKSI